MPTTARPSSSSPSNNPTHPDPSPSPRRSRNAAPSPPRGRSPTRGRSLTIDHPPSLRVETSTPVAGIADSAWHANNNSEASTAYSRASTRAIRRSSPKAPDPLSDRESRPHSPRHGASPPTSNYPRGSRIPSFSDPFSSSHGGRASTPQDASAEDVSPRAGVPSPRLPQVPDNTPGSSPVRVVGATLADELKGAEPVDEEESAKGLREHVGGCTGLEADVPALDPNYSACHCDDWCGTAVLERARLSGEDAFQGQYGHVQGAASPSVGPSTTDDVLFEWDEEMIVQIWQQVGSLLDDVGSHTSQLEDMDETVESLHTQVACLAQELAGFTMELRQLRREKNEIKEFRNALYKKEVRLRRVESVVRKQVELGEMVQVMAASMLGHFENGHLVGGVLHGLLEEEVRRVLGQIEEERVGLEKNKGEEVSEVDAETEEERKWFRDVADGDGDADGLAGDKV